MEQLLAIDAEALKAMLTEHVHQTDAASEADLVPEGTAASGEPGEAGGNYGEPTASGGPGVTRRPGGPWRLL